MGLDPQFLDAALDWFLLYTEIRPGLQLKLTRNGQPDLVKALYTPSSNVTAPRDLISGKAPGAGHIGVPPRTPDKTQHRYQNPIPILLPSSACNDMGVSTLNRLMLRVRTPAGDDNWLLEPYALLRKLPGFMFSSFSILQQESDLSSITGLVSIDSYRHLLQEAAHAAGDPGPVPEVCVVLCNILETTFEAPLYALKPPPPLAPTGEACCSMPWHLILGPVGGGFEACHSMPQYTENCSLPLCP